MKKLLSSQLPYRFKPLKSSTSNKPKKSDNSLKIKRKYNESFLQCGFTFVLKEDEHCQVCLICNEMSTNESLKLANLKRHFYANAILIAISLWSFLSIYWEHQKDRSNQ